MFRCRKKCFVIKLKYVTYQNILFAKTQGIVSINKPEKECYFFTFTLTYT